MLYQLSYPGTPRAKNPRTRRSLTAVFVAVQPIALRRRTGDGITVAKPFEQVAILAAAAAERRMFGGGRLAA